MRAGNSDHKGHGTLMAGLATWGDLTAALAGTPPPPEHVLESVVLLPPMGVAATRERLWGAYTLSAVSEPEAKAPDRDRVFCMTVTAADYRDRGKPSSWSAELDILCEGRRDAVPRLIVISGGKVPQNQWQNYDAENDTVQVHDPGQAWNALTVGAYTDNVYFEAADFPGHTLIAPGGALSPSSTTSVTWGANWPVALKAAITRSRISIGTTMYPRRMAGKRILAKVPT